MSRNSNAKPCGAGRSSYDLVDHNKVFRALKLRKGSRFLDMACGPGDYAIEAARMLGGEGVVYAADLWPEALARLRTKAKAQNLENINTIIGDVSRTLPMGDATVDVCLIATALHDFVREGVSSEALEEAGRVLKPGGSLAILEFKKMEGPPGPPIDVRLAPEEVERLVSPHGFAKEKFTEVGAHTYLMVFKRIRHHAKQRGI
jgi:ubiquinone/menaquinone biosynthesis C-methylase UbiE